MHFDGGMKKKLHSFVVPVYNSKNALSVLVDRISNVMNHEGSSFEVILVDDGSKDGSFDEIKRLASMHSFVRGFQLSRNFGQQAALLIGLERAEGDCIAIMDDDLQDPPEILPRFFQVLDNGQDIVYGIRKSRKEGWLKRFFYAAFYRILDLLCATKIPLDAGDFCVMNRKAANAILKLKSTRPFLRGSRAWIGFKQIGLLYERAARLDGNSGYTFKKYLQFAITGILAFSYIPLRLITYFGLTTAFICVIYTILVIAGRLMGTFSVPGYTSTLVVLVFFGAVQLVSIGVVGEYIARLFDETKNWPIAFVSETTEGAMSREHSCVGR